MPDFDAIISEVRDASAVDVVRRKYLDQVFKRTNRPNLHTQCVKIVENHMGCGTLVSPT